MTRMDIGQEGIRLCSRKRIVRNNLGKEKIRVDLSGRIVYLFVRIFFEKHGFCSSKYKMENLYSCFGNGVSI